MRCLLFSNLALLLAPSGPLPLLRPLSTSKTLTFPQTEHLHFRPSLLRHRITRRQTPQASIESLTKDEMQIVSLKVEHISPEAFKEFGQVIVPAEDGGVFGPEDAQLDLSKGIPRFYLMRLRDKELGFDRITHHAQVTQCLAGAGAGTWYLAVAPPSNSEGGDWTPPRIDDVRAFAISGATIVKLHAGTWHAGPLFTEPAMDFYNLELAYTNVDDHNTHDFAKLDGVVFRFDA